MDTIEFKIVTITLPNGRKDMAVQYLINNTNLFVHIGYGVESQCGLPPDIVFLPSKHLLGSPDVNYYDADLDKIILSLDCHTLLEGGDSIIAKIDCNKNLIVWKDFQMAKPEYNEWISKNINNPVFQFNRLQYEKALERL